MALMLHVIHATTCPSGKATPGVREVATMSVPDEALPHGCLPGGYAFESVLLASVEVGPHEYEPGNLHPMGMWKPLCRHCRNPERSH
jgi:hypothetical protein